MERVTVTELLSKRNAKALTEEDIEDLWYDWFCKDSALVNKGKGLLARLAKLNKVNNNKFNPDRTYVFFKNNCPCRGRLYDDFRICDIETGDVIWTVVPKSGFDSNYGEAELWGAVNDFKEAVVRGSWNDVVNYFKS